MTVFELTCLRYDLSIYLEGYRVTTDCVRATS